MPLAADTNGREKWLIDAMSGDFTNMPTPFTWSQSAAFAHVVDGYGVAGGVTACVQITDSAIDSVVDPDDRGASAVTLWVALFGEHRRYRHGGYPPGPSELLYLDALCAELRERLRNLGTEELDRVRAVMKAHPGLEVQR